VRQLTTVEKNRLTDALIGYSKYLIRQSRRAKTEAAVVELENRADTFDSLRWLLAGKIITIAEDPKWRKPLK
jgi:hypothetical protein